MINQDVQDGSIVINGMGEVKAMPDALCIEYAVECSGKDAKSLTKDVELVVVKFFAELKQLGLENYTTASDIVIESVFSEKEHKAPRRLIGYKGSRIVKVKLSDFSIIGKVNAHALECGMTRILGHEYSISNRRKYEDEAIQLAAENVTHQAEILSHAFGVAVNKPSCLKLYNEQDYYPHPKARVAMCLSNAPDAMEDADGYVISKPEPLTIRARIEATYSYQH